MIERPHARDVAIDPPPEGEWVIGLWFGDWEPPESGTMMILGGRWVDEIGDPVADADGGEPTHWIPLPERP